MLKRFLDFLLPIYCVGCRLEGTLLCDDCNNLIRATDAFRCPFCDVLIPGGRTCPKHETMSLKGCLPCGYYHDPILQNAIKTLKYTYAEELAKPLARRMAQSALKFRTIIPEADMIIPIPLSRRKQRARGFNQSLPLATAIANTLHIPLATDALVRTKHTTPQAKLSDEKRRKNMHNAFEVRDNVIKKSILLIDDVLTTGATLEAAAMTLKDAGARQIFAMVLARG